jgi:hypothetical protein
LKKICPKVKESRPSVGTGPGRTRAYVYLLPPLDECRKVFEEFCKFRIPWDVDEKPEPTLPTGTLPVTEPPPAGEPRVENPALESLPLPAEQQPPHDGRHEAPDLPACFGEFNPKSEKCMSQCSFDEGCEDAFVKGRRAARSKKQEELMSVPDLANSAGKGVKADMGIGEDSK